MLTEGSRPNRDDLIGDRVELLLLLLMNLIEFSYTKLQKANEEGGDMEDPNEISDGPEDEDDLEARNRRQLEMLKPGA